MEPAHGRRLSRLAITLWVAPPALVAVWVWAEPDGVRAYASFVAVTAVVLAALTGRAGRPWS